MEMFFSGDYSSSLFTRSRLHVRAHVSRVVQRWRLPPNIFFIDKTRRASCSRGVSSSCMRKYFSQRRKLRVRVGVLVRAMRSSFEAKKTWKISHGNELFRCKRPGWSSQSAVSTGRDSTAPQSAAVCERPDIVISSCATLFRFALWLCVGRTVFLFRSPQIFFSFAQCYNAIGCVVYEPARNFARSQHFCVFFDDFFFSCT